MRRLAACALGVAVTSALLACGPSKQVVTLQRACDTGNAQSCWDLGVLYYKGESVKQDLTRAAQLSGRACDAGLAKGCNALGAAYSAGEGVKEDRARALQLYQRACAGAPSGCTNIGLAYERGDGVAQDLVKAGELLQRACADGTRWTCGELARLRASIETAARYERECDAGDFKSCQDLGRMYDDGKGVLRDKARAAELHQKACDGSYAPACYSLGTHYSYGDGVPKDTAKGRQLYQKACDGGVAEACKEAKDLVKAAQLFEKGCEGGNTEHCIELGFAYSVGEGVTQDDAKAVEFFEKGKACERSDRPACEALRFARVVRFAPLAICAAGVLVIVIVFLACVVPKRGFRLRAGGTQQ